MAQVLTWPNEAYSARVLKFIRAAGNYEQGVKASFLDVTVCRRRGREPPIPTPANFGFPSMKDLLLKMASQGEVETKEVGMDLLVRAPKATRDMWTRQDTTPRGTSPASATRGITGLKNTGNTCYINATLQVILISRELFLIPVESHIPV